MFNPIDTLVNFFDPMAGLKRTQARQLKAQYEAAFASNVHTNKPNKRSTGTSNQINQVSGLLRDRARYADENNPFATAIFDELCTNVVGSDGIHVGATPKNADGSINTEFARQINDWWREYELGMDLCGERGRAEMELLICRTWLRDGEVFTQAISGRGPGLRYPTSTPYAVLPLEPDYISSMDVNRFMDGIERNHLGQPVNYSVETGNTYRVVPAADMQHLRFERRLHQNRGTSILHSSIDLLADVRDYDTAERIKSDIAARAAMFIQSDDNSSSHNDDYVLGMGNSFQIGRDEKVGIIQASDHAMSMSFRSAQLKQVCSAAQVNASSVSREYDGNYSAQRQELIDSFSRYRTLQTRFIGRVTRPHRNGALKMAILSGQLTVPRTVVNPLAAVYQAPVLPWIDPAKEATGIDKAIKTGLNSISHYQRERGYNPDEVRAERADEIAQDAERGIVTTSSPEIMLRGKNESKN